eukprot:TRINITY_DN622_c0_g3_i5.p1 TRINITY_DN622_c0_g3~~TRINITY_DN622_c0_g3_i5.p1  ORF type:complete len:634 (+),score=94.40 TRINITY_DN622_c0_g3_i5:129-1904(+)
MFIEQQIESREIGVGVVAEKGVGVDKEKNQIIQQIGPQKRLQHQIYSELQRLFQESPELANQAHVVNAFKSLARKQQKQIHPKTLNALIQIFNQNWEFYDSQAIAKIVWGMGKKKIQLDQNNKKNVILAVRSRLDEFVPHELVDVVYGLTELNICDKQIMNEIGDQVSLRYEQMSQNYYNRLILERISQEMCILAWCFARQKFKHKEFFDSIVQIYPKLNRNLRMQNLASLVWSFARLEFDEKNQIFPLIMKQLDRKIYEFDEKLTPFNFNKIVWSFCSVNYVPIAFEQFVLNFLKKNIRQFGGYELFDFLRVWEQFEKKNLGFGEILLFYAKKVTIELEKNDVAIFLPNFINLQILQNFVVFFQQITFKHRYTKIRSSYNKILRQFITHIDIQNKAIIIQNNLDNFINRDKNNDKKGLVKKKKKSFMEKLRQGWLMQKPAEKSSCAALRLRPRQFVSLLMPLLIVDAFRQPVHVIDALQQQMQHAFATFPALATPLELPTALFYLKLIAIMSTIYTLRVQKKMPCSSFSLQEVYSVPKQHSACFHCWMRSQLQSDSSPPPLYQNERFGLFSLLDAILASERLLSSSSLSK